MKNLFIIVFILISNSIFGQQVEFRSEKIDTIEFISSVGPDETKSLQWSIDKVNRFIIVFDSISQKYIVKDYLIETNRYSIETREEKIDKKSIDKFENETIQSIDIQNLVAALDTNIYPITFDHLNHTELEFEKFVHEQSVVLVAEKYEIKRKFERKYSEEEIQIIFKDCYNIDTFNLFLKYEFVFYPYPVFEIGYWNFINFFIKTNKANYRFESSYNYTYRQPWNEIVTGDSTYRSILNFELNEQIIKILPNDFLNMVSLKKESLYNRYIEWYIKRKGILL